MFRYFTVLFLILLTDFSFGQIVLTQTHNDATIGIDRKAWNGLGNTSSHSDGYAHDFTLLGSTTNSCQQITSIAIDINLTNYTNNNACPHFETYYNLFYGCTSYTGGATCLPATNLIAEPNYPVNVSPPPFNFGNPLGSPVNPNIVPGFGDNLGIDIITVSNPGCNPVTNGHISYQYTITVTITVTDTTPTEPTTPLECWENRSFDNSVCDWNVSGAQPMQPVIECWETAIFNNTSCTWEVTGTQPVQPIIECWQTASFNTTSCIWEVSGSQPVQPNLECWQTATFNSTTCMWEVSGTQPIAPNTECWQTAIFNTTSCIWEISGTQPVEPATACWQTATFNPDTCAWEITGTQPGNTTEDARVFCPEEIKTLNAQTAIPNPIFLWNTGEMTKGIDIVNQGTYTVEITGDICAFETRIFNVSFIDTPIIEDIISDGRDIVVNISNTGDFLYSLDGGDTFQNSNTFFNIEGGSYTIVVKDRNCEDTVTMQHLHFYIPKFFTPNNDGVNDTFNLGGIEFYKSSEVSIFNRYGKLMKFSRNSPFSWNGMFSGRMLPSGDYWYVIIINGQKFTGHFTLKR
ncbi:T9SS type B sorting domain-containing protein [Hyunsoonleella sp. 2307UL5-6]|uniref:T9SS type B sorting domain-containing protein n=1 Tax=Hyunsoonleella sp. 2307UL5-6 TaxID=3384768 RepID=UPI0039BC8209